MWGVVLLLIVHSVHFGVCVCVCVCVCALCFEIAKEHSKIENKRNKKVKQNIRKKKIKKKKMEKKGFIIHIYL